MSQIYSIEIAGFKTEVNKRVYDGFNNMLDYGKKLEKERDELQSRVKFLNGALDLVLVDITQDITSARQEIEDEYGYDYFERRASR